MDAMELRQVFEEVFSRGAMKACPIDLPGGKTGIIVPAGYEVAEFAPITPVLPDVTTATVRAADLAAFVALVTEFKKPESRIFVTTPHSAGVPTCFQAIIDYHTTNGPGRCAHRIVYAPRYSQEWEIWNNAASLKSMKQAEFAEFIEDNRIDIVDPTAAAILDIITNLKANRRIEYDSMVHQPNGSTLLSYSDTVTAEHRVKGVALTVPEVFKIAIPVFAGYVRLTQPVFLRFTLDTAKVTFRLKLDRPTYTEQDAVDRMIKTIVTETGLPVFLGQP